MNDENWSGTLRGVARRGEQLILTIIGGATALHDPREFTVSIREEHAAVLSEDLPRRVLLAGALAPLCDHAGTTGDIDQQAAAQLLDAVLLQPADAVDAFLTGLTWDRGILVAHGADIDVLDRGMFLEALRAATAAPLWQRAAEDEAVQRRARAGVTLAPLDAAILRYTGHYLHGASSIPRRLPDAVPAELLPDVLRVIDTAQEATADLRIARDARSGPTGSDRADWRRMEAATARALEAAYPALAAEAIASVGFLMCSESANRALHGPYDIDDDTDAASTPRTRRPGRTLLFTDLQEVTRTWTAGDEVSAVEAFWSFVAERYGSQNQLFILEDEAVGDGVQFLFHMDAAARLRMIAPATDSDEAEYLTELCLVDGLAEYRALARAYVARGFDGLDDLARWTADDDEFDAWAEERHAAQRAASGVR